MKRRRREWNLVEEKFIVNEEMRIKIYWKRKGAGGVEDEKIREKRFPVVDRSL